MALFPGFADTRHRLDNGLTLRVRSAGQGPAVLLLHGYPQTGACWHRVAPQLVQAGFRVIVPDLRGYGGSDKPAPDAGHATYSKRAMAADMVALMRDLGHDRFAMAGHDRGGRVAHRLALDWPDALSRVAVLDIAPTATMYASTDMEFATAYYHWFFLIQPAPFPERMIGADPEYYLRTKLGSWGKSGMTIYDPEAVAEYVAAFRDPACIAATCADYRAAASIDLEHDRADAEARIAVPLLALWGAAGLVGRKYDVLQTWRDKALDVRGGPVTGGHFLPEESADETAQALIDFFAGMPAE
ncbi:MAG: alpha/beta hydrolase [Roseivivax sp.]|nr:alpha/beta hydrolase [Roseivivax sp.]